MDVKPIVAMTLSLLSACVGPPARVASVPALSLPGTDGRQHDLRADAAATTATVYVFYDSRCPCVAAHLERLKALRETFGARGVEWYFVDSEVGASVERDRGFATPFSMLADEGGKLARATGAEFAGYAVLVDRDGAVRYSGGVDDDRSHLRDDATPYLKDALEDLLAGAPVRRPEGKTLGCALQLW